MTSEKPGRRAADRPRPTASARGRRHRHRLLGAIFVLLLAPTAFAAAHHLLDGKISALAGAHRPDGSPAGWPQQGQAAIVLGGGRPAASPHEEAVPIASLAKVMTAYLTLERYPLSATAGGFTITVSAAQAQAETQDAAQGQSDVPVAPGEQLTERQLLEALLIPSGNNIAQMLASTVAGSESRFVTEMNAEARALGMNHTIDTDPSGFDPGTVSTAADQLRVFQRAMRLAIFRQIVSMASVTLPVAGILTNFDPVIAEGYAGKTGSDSAAGGCLAFFRSVTVGGRRQTAVGVVLGQGQGNDTSVLLAAAGEAAEQLVDSMAPTTGARTASPPDVIGGRNRGARAHDGRRAPLAPIPTAHRESGRPAFGEGQRGTAEAGRPQRPPRPPLD